MGDGRVKIIQEYVLYCNFLRCRIVQLSGNMAKTSDSSSCSFLENKMGRGRQDARQLGENRTLPDLQQQQDF